MRGPHEFEVGNFTYRASPMEARVQINVVRRVSPLVVGMVQPIINQLLEKRKTDAAIAKATGGEARPPSILDLDISKALPGLASAMQAVASMPDADFDYVQEACLRLVERQRTGDTGWVKIWNVAARQPQFDDIEGHDLLTIMISVLRVEIGPFFSGLISSLTESGQT